MAKLNGTPTNILPNSHIEAAQSVTPTKATDPRLSRQVAITDSATSAIFRRRFQAILYYKKALSEESGWLLVGWMKLSLGKALEEQPILAGRLRRGEGGKGELEIVSNDSGVRVIEARISTTLAEFLDLKEREDAEAELVFWNDVDDQNPQFSPLFYIQVTNFQCGGYSIGISCSLVLADPLAIISFLRRWVNIHNRMVSEADEAKPPLFYLPNFK
ncbi:protein ECERIFERUM 26-like, partial [Camellia sinensis]|uniref:protein ECERIFERUM 26-like n=1 Tax=Camellia sinensis TaxID=4442 RepID=UPI001036A593